MAEQAVVRALLRIRHAALAQHVAADGSRVLESFALTRG